MASAPTVVEVGDVLSTSNFSVSGQTSSAQSESQLQAGTQQQQTFFHNQVSGFSSHGR